MTTLKTLLNRKDSFSVLISSGILKRWNNAKIDEPYSKINEWKRFILRTSNYPPHSYGKSKTIIDSIMDINFTRLNGLYLTGSSTSQLKLSTLFIPDLKLPQFRFTLCSIVQNVITSVKSLRKTLTSLISLDISRTLTIFIGTKLWRGNRRKTCPSWQRDQGMGFLVRHI